MVDGVSLGLQGFRAAKARAVERERVAAGIGQSREGNIEERPVARVPERMPEHERHAPLRPPARTRPSYQRRRGSGIHRSSSYAAAGGASSGGTGAGRASARAPGVATRRASAARQGAAARPAVRSPSAFGRRCGDRRAGRPRAAAASLAADFASPKSFDLRNWEKPWAIPAASPETFSTGVAIAVDRAHGRVGAVGHRDGAVGDGVCLVELVVDAVDRGANLHDHGQQVALGSLDERREPLERLAEPEQHERRGEPDRDEEHRETPVGGVSGGGCELHHRGDPTRLRRR